MLEGRALGGGSGLGKQKEGQSRYPGRTEGGALLAPWAWLLDSVPEKSFPGPGMFSNTLPLCMVTPALGCWAQGRSASPGPCAFPVMEKDEPGPPWLGPSGRA